MHKQHNLFVKNSIRGFKFKSIKSPSSEDVESTRLDIEVDFSEMHVRAVGDCFLLLFLASLVMVFLILMIASHVVFQLLREAGRSVVDILKVDLITFFYVPKEASALSESWQITFG